MARSDGYRRQFGRGAYGQPHDRARRRWSTDFGWLSAGKHGYPFDRMLAAQAQFEDIPFVTADPVFRAFDVRVLW